MRNGSVQESNGLCANKQKKDSRTSSTHKPLTYFVSQRISHSHLTGQEISLSYTTLFGWEFYFMAKLISGRHLFESCPDRDYFQASFLQLLSLQITC